MPTATTDDPSQLIAQAINSVASLSTLPEVTTQIIRTVEDKNSSAQTLHKIVSHDPALVMRVLKVVNSAFYGLPGQIASIDRAIVMLGLNAVKNIAVAASLGQMFRGVKLCEGFTAKDLWTHCVAVACAARDLAKQAKLPVADEAFLAGMIHDIGLLIALQTWPEKLRAACEQARTSGRRFIDVENEILGVNHQQLGQALCEKWNFPRSCALVAGHHHDAAGTAESQLAVVGVVAVADSLVAMAGVGFTLTRLHDPVDPALAAGLGLTPEQIEATRARLPQLLEAASAIAA
jgi:HD-like signal output (HDOD) protein